jgi:zinc protease
MREGELKRLKREMLTALEAERVEPSVLAAKHFHAQLFGSNHPAGRLSSVESVKRVSAGDVRAAWQRLATPAGATLVWAGDLDAAATEATCGALFDSWQGRVEAAPIPTEAGPRPPGLNIRLVDKPDLTQTTLMIGHLLPGEEGPCRNELALANYILGGGNFSSRLMKEVRARLGGTYGISSQVSRVRRFGTLSISTSTINSRVREMLDTTLGVYRGVVEGGVTEEELNAAKRFVVGNMAFQLEGIGNVAEKLLWLRLYNRDTAYLENFADTISAIGREAVNCAIREYFSIDNLVVAAVGKAEAVRGQLAGLGALSECHFRDPIR